MNTLAIDIETASSVNLLTSGVYKYCDSRDFKILLFAYSINDGPVKCVEVAMGYLLPDELFEALTKPNYLKTSWNVAFERTCISKFYGLELPVEQWECTMVKASRLGLPMSLDQAGTVLNLPTKKDKAGNALIKFFSVPRKDGKFNLPVDDMTKWLEFKNYCVRDVEVEREIGKKISFFETTDDETNLWNLDQEINSRGILFDPELVKSAMKIDSEYREELVTECIEITGVANPNSVKQLKDWLEKESDTEIKDLTKAAIPELLKQNLGEDCNRVLEIRQELSKTSIKKYQAMLNYAQSDNRLRGLFQFNGANRTGRWGGRGVQLHNLPRNNMKRLDFARQVIRTGDTELAKMLIDKIPQTLSELIRTAFIPRDGHVFVISDFSAIEARVAAWLAKEQWRLEVFRTHGKIYEASAAMMFNIPIEMVTKDSDYRTRGKIAELALGYQGGKSALERMDIKKQLKNEEYQPIVDKWRAKSPSIVNYWNMLNEAVIDVVSTGSRRKCFYVSLFMEKGILFVELPSGRRLSYLKPKVVENKFGFPGVVYAGIDQVTKTWGFTDTYGGKLFENICQAVARDCLADSMLRLNRAGYTCVCHVHDEVILEVPRANEQACKEVDKIMSSEISWAKGLPLKAESYMSPYYKKD